MNSSFYFGEVTHKRFRPRAHQLRYRVFTMLVDIDELTILDSSILSFGYNRSRPMSFYDKDHGPLDGSPLRPWVQEQLIEAGIKEKCCRIALLCYPRLFGYVFNPLSIFFCYARDGSLIATLYEVCNTFSERHTYLFPVSQCDQKVIRQECPKTHYVSPFIDMTGLYRFSLSPPGDDVRLAIRYEDAGELVLAASFQGRAKKISNLAAVTCLLRSPLQSLKVIAGIHLEALYMWIKGFKIYSHVSKKERASVSIHAEMSNGENSQ